MSVIQELGVETLSEDDVAGLNRLLVQLSARAVSVTFDAVWHMLAGNARIVVARSGSDSTFPIIGMGTVVFVEKLMGCAAQIEDVVVDAGERGGGIGGEVMGELIRIARGARAKRINLTSTPARAAANRLYQQFGFKLRETNVYRLEL